jgi:hypothetical protein
MMSGNLMIMKVRIISAILLTSTLCMSLYSQDTLNKDQGFTERNSIQVKALGNGFYIFSVNYERIILNGNRFKTAGQIGFGGLGNEINLPIVINENFSFNENHLET